MVELVGFLHSENGSAALGPACFFTGWSTTGIEFGEPVHLSFSPADSLLPTLAQAFLRITVGSEFHAECIIDVHAGPTGEHLGFFDIRFPCVFQPFHLSLNVRQAQEVLTCGVCLSMRISGPELRIISACPETGSLPALIFSSEDERAPMKLWDNLYKCLYSYSGIQPFNWIEGCVLDALADMELIRGDSHALSALERHLACFVDDSGRLDYIGPIGNRIENRLVGIESGLPFAPIARIHPEHPVLEVFDRYLANAAGPEGLIVDRAMDAEGRISDATTVTIEACYTLAYPAAVRGIQLSDEGLLRTALNQIRLRESILIVDGFVHQRCVPGNSPEQGAWARATCWYLLGTAKTIRMIFESPYADALFGQLAPIRAVLSNVCGKTLQLQRQDGLWHNYLDDPKTGIDTSGSAGIAAAFAILSSIGVLDDSYLTSASRTFHALSDFILPDGHLCGAAQLNRGGDSLQRGSYRVAAPFASALALQLSVALHAENHS